MSTEERRTPAVPRPSASVIVVSPENQVLLLRRVHTSSSFPSAHVFPGGNISSFHDGELPPPDEAARHEDSEAYRLAAIRETFEESGILLARNNGFGRLIEVEDAERDSGRRKVHSNEIDFRTWLAGKGGRADTDGLIPFTRWVSPTTIAKRFSTQMYIYLLPLSHPASLSGSSSEADSEGSEVVIPDPTHDGGKEHTAARFLPPSTWIRLAQSGRVIIYPPQFFLLSMLAPFLSPHNPRSSSTPAPSYEERQAHRKAMLEFVRGGDPPWAAKVICPIILPPAHGGKREDGRQVLGLDRPGPELKGVREGEKDHVVIVDFTKEGPRRLELRNRDEVVAEGRERKL